MGVETFSEVDGVAFFNVVNAIVVFGVEDDFTGITDVTFSQEGALGTLGAFDRGGETTDMRGEPSHHLRRL